MLAQKESSQKAEEKAQAQKRRAKKQMDAEMANDCKELEVEDKSARAKEPGAWRQASGEARTAAETKQASDEEAATTGPK